MNEREVFPTNHSEIGLFIDNGVFQQLIKSHRNSEFRKNWNEVFNRYVKRKTKTVRYLTTAFLVLEALGLTSKQIGRPTGICAVPDTTSPWNQFHAILEFGKNYYQEREALQKPQLDLAFSELLSFSNPEDGYISRILNDTIRRALNHSEFPNILHIHLAHRYAQNRELYFDFLPVALSIFFDALHNRIHGNDLSIYKAMHDLLHELKENELSCRSTPAIYQAMLKDFRLPQFKSKADWVDSELIHFSILGLNEDNHIPVTIVTAEENILAIAERIYWAKGLYKLFLKRAKEQRPELFLRTLPGRVIFVDNASCQFKQLFKVKKFRSWPPAINKANWL